MAKSNRTTLHFNTKDLRGIRFGQLLVVSFSHADKFRHTLWNVRCDCGTTKQINSSSLQRGLSRSCGCRQSPGTHKMSATSTYISWSGMIQRTTNPNIPRWCNYGGRGIHVCQRWLVFENFLADMGVRPDGMQIDRIDNTGNYEPGNCRWATPAQQSRNMRRTRILTYDGITMCVEDWARRIGIRRCTLHVRLRNWPLERALTTPKLH
jgi:hypothetical protein